MSFSDAFALVGWLSRVRRVRVAGKVCRADGACKLRLIIHTYAFMGWWGLGLVFGGLLRGASARARASLMSVCVADNKNNIRATSMWQSFHPAPMMMLSMMLIVQLSGRRERGSG